jgi:hypothetical protein
METPLDKALCKDHLSRRKLFCSTPLSAAVPKHGSRPENLWSFASYPDAATASCRWPHCVLHILYLRRGYPLTEGILYKGCDGKLTTRQMTDEFWMTKLLSTLQWLDAGQVLLCADQHMQHHNDGDNNSVRASLCLEVVKLHWMAGMSSLTCHEIYNTRRPRSIQAAVSCPNATAACNICMDVGPTSCTRVGGHDHDVLRFFRRATLG